MPFLQDSQPPLHRNFASAPHSAIANPLCGTSSLRPSGLAWIEAQRTSDHGRAIRNGTGEYQPLPTAASKRTTPATKENCLYNLAEREFSVSGLIRRDGGDARRGPTMVARISVARPPRSRPVTIRRATEKLRKEISSDDASARRPPWRSVG